MKTKRAHREFYDTLETLLGTLYLVLSAEVLIGLSFQRPTGLEYKNSEYADFAKQELIEYFSHGEKYFTCKTEFKEGTEFEKKVWTVLKEIPYGETRTYKWLAGQIGNPHAFRAVGQALGKNPIPIIFPCHRIIESDGHLGGYSEGTEIKRRLLELEYYTLVQTG